MNGARAMDFEALEVKAGGIAFVLGKTVRWVFGIEAEHDAITGDLGKDAGGGDALALAVAFDDGGVRNGKWADGQAVDEGVLGQRRKGADSTPHGLVGGAEDVDAVDLVVLDDRDGPADIRARGEREVDLLALAGGQLLGVVDTGMAEAVRQDDGGGDHRASQRSAAGFVDAGNALETGLAQSILMFERAAHDHAMSGGLFANSHCLLALASAQVIEL